jgi:hypothetical protein
MQVCLVAQTEEQVAIKPVELLRQSWVAPPLERALNLMPPSTSSLAVGETVPIPTKPFSLTVKPAAYYPRNQF